MSTLWSHRCRTNLLVAGILLLGAYALVFDSHRDVINGDDAVDLTELEQELDSSNPVLIVSYKSPLDESIFRPRPLPELHGDGAAVAPGANFQSPLGKAAADNRFRYRFIFISLWLATRFVRNGASRWRSPHPGG